MDDHINIQNQSVPSYYPFSGFTAGLKRSGGKMLDVAEQKL